MVENLLPHDHGSDSRAKYFFQLLSGENRFAAAAEVFKLLDDPNRVRIFWLLCHSEACVINIAALTGMSPPAVSHHLQLLRASGLIESRRDGKEAYYRAADTVLAELLHEALDRVLNIACPKLTDADSTRAVIEQVHDYLRTHLEQKITIDALALRFHINTTTLKKEFKAVYGTSVAAHIRKHRMEEAARLLRTTENSIAAIASAVGYESQSRFALVFKSEYGMLPTAYRCLDSVSLPDDADSALSDAAQFHPDNNSQEKEELIRE